MARYAREPRTAERAFLALVTRFPDAPLAADAVFSLGRLAFEAGRAAARSYLARAPEGLHAPLAERVLQDAP